MTLITIANLSTVILCLWTIGSAIYFKKSTKTLLAKKTSERFSVLWGVFEFRKTKEEFFDIAED